ncbi:peptidylprolyl isomerase PrsA [Candidatus Cetobacterium colombiensis]|uniref:Uncharacterized protein n=1 Tax=Candidatus Cetobacterium colombiensis TaxID=3073100 RepID=A0ABU4W9H8_9FUSO|nr:hypothetical protein [Candidatus Cetobacterium colombiensis]MDX8336192.1 hypothetical protein [Candidatus Cetobacterium colombiensis]
MSLYLGKIHYWLFNKILWFENLEDLIINLAKEKGLDVKKVEYEIESKYGKKLENKNLEEIIDLENIHEWLQNRIHSSEGRMATWIRVILQSDVKFSSEIEKLFEENAKEAAKKEKIIKNYLEASEIYTCLNNYILDGMPCDRVNIVKISDKDSVYWERRICVHEDIWNNENLSVEIFYKFRNIWIENFVTELNPDFQFLEEKNINYKIVRV